MAMHLLTSYHLLNRFTRKSVLLFLDAAYWNELLKRSHPQTHTATYSHFGHMQTKPVAMTHSDLSQKQVVTDDAEMWGPLSDCFSYFFPARLLWSEGQMGLPNHHSLSRTQCTWKTWWWQLIICVKPRHMKQCFKFPIKISGCYMEICMSQAMIVLYRDSS